MKGKLWIVLLALFVVFLMVPLFLDHRMKTVEETLARAQKDLESETGSAADAETEKSTESEKNTEAETNSETESRITENHTEEAEMGDEETEEEMIRVLILSSEEDTQYHQSVTVQCDKPYQTEQDGATSDHPETETFSLSSGDCQEGEVWILSSEDGMFTLPSVIRSVQDLTYPGTLQIEKRKEGLVLINELPMEEYLMRVVPSEMPSSYPLEALKAQAVSARTYARKQKEAGRLREFGADVDDSVNFQVYNNQAMNRRTTRAVKATEGVVMKQDGVLLDALYYSTSCGIDLTRNLSEEAVFCSFISGTEESDYEKEEPWYRWTTSFSLEELTKLVRKSGLKVGRVEALKEGPRTEQGRLQSLTVTGKKGETVVEGEYDIRTLLVPEKTPVTLKNGEEAPDLGMLPSAFFYLEPILEENELTGYELIGGGYGHGDGMSQNGARHMAEEGLTYQEILTHYYGEIEWDEESHTGD